jgi:hypothetical protein
MLITLFPVAAGGSEINGPKQSAAISENGRIFIRPFFFGYRRWPEWL